MGIDGPTRGASDDAVWRAQPGRALLVRAAVIILPMVASFATAHFVSGVLWHPSSLAGFLVFVAQLAVVGSTAALLSERALRKLLPLAALFNLTLVFPDHAPSRFGVALRTGTLKRLADPLGNGLAADHQQAAEQLVALVGALGSYERLTRGHTERVRAYTDLIAEELGLPTPERDLLRWAALVHDIGKLGVPAEILNKAGRPTDEEWQLLRQHPAIGAELVEPLASWLGPWRLATAQHHERWDGEGYPLGLAGSEISLAGRIVAVADAYDVITSTRSYKPAMSGEAARRELVDCSGTHFDPAVVRAFLSASLGGRRNRFAFFAWLGELGGLLAAPQGAASVALTSTAAAVAVGGVLSVSLLIGPAEAPLEASEALGLFRELDPEPQPTALGFIDAGVTVAPDAASEREPNAVPGSTASGPASAPTDSSAPDSDPSLDSTTVLDSRDEATDPSPVLQPSSTQLPTTPPPTPNRRQPRGRQQRRRRPQQRRPQQRCQRPLRRPQQVGDGRWATRVVVRARP